MITYEAVESNLRMADTTLRVLVGDMSDGDLLVRPTEGANHIAWQLGHLIGSEYFLISQVADQVEMAIPAGWSEKYSKDTAKSDDLTHFEPLDRYLELYAAQRQATLNILKDLPPEQLEEPGPEFLQMVVNTVGELFLFMAHHELMHAGQFTCVRRKLDKPVLF
jgi:uncharacterized damage-inducible protein DinB